MVKLANHIPEEVRHRDKILKQITRCDELFSGFDPAPTMVDSKLEKTNFQVEAHKGKKIALAVLVLYAECESVLPKEFFEHFEKKHRQQKAFGEPFQFLATEPIHQFKGIMKIWFFYKELLNAIWSLADFSDVAVVYKRREIDLFDIDEEDSLFTDGD